MRAETGEAGAHLPRSAFARKARAMLGRLARPGRGTPAGGGLAALVLVTIAMAGPALGQAVKPVWSDNEDGRANLFMGPQPDYAKSLGAQYAVGQGAAKALKRGDVDGIPSSVWVTEALGTGSRNLRWRWVVDGVPKKWSATNQVKVSAKPLAKATTIDAFGDGSVTLTMDGTYEVGRFEDGEWYAVAPKGLKITHATPARTGAGKSLRNGASVDLDFLDQGLDGRGSGFRQASVAGLNETINPGSVLVKVKSQPEGKANSHISRMATLTVLSERPPAGSFRPTVYEHGERALRNEAEIDLDRVPRIDYDAASFPSLAAIKNWRLKQLTRPAPPLGHGDDSARKLYPEGQSAAYHRTQRQDLTLPAHLIMASNLTDEGERMALAKALVQREIDILGAFSSKRATGAKGSAPAYFVTPTVFAGTLLRDPEMRGATAAGLAPGDWNFGSRGQWKYSSWADSEAFAALSPAQKNKFWRAYRDLDKAGPDMRKDGVQVWSKLLEERTIKFNPRVEEAKKLEALGIVYNGDGTWTIPADRFSDGGLYQWSVNRGPRGGETRLLDPNWKNDRGDGAWSDKSNPPAKQDAYIAQHAVAAVSMAPLLMAVAGEDYLANGTSTSGATAWELFSGYAQQWMRQSPEWMAALGFKQHGAYPYQQGDGATAGTNDWRNFDTAFIDTGYFARWDDFAPVFELAAPDPATRQMFTLIGTKKGFEFRLDGIPHDGWSRLTDVEIRIDGGDWLSTGLTKIGDIYAHDIKAGAYLVAMRAVNAFGAGTASGTKQIGAGKTSAPPAKEPDAPASSGGGGQPTGGSRVPAADAPALRSRVGPASAALIVGPAEISASLLRSTVAVPVPPTLPLLLAALAGLGLAGARSMRRLY